MQTKLTSTNPNLYQKIDNLTALTGYKDYVEAVIKQEIYGGKGLVPKTFNQWLETEIWMYDENLPEYEISNDISKEWKQPITEARAKTLKICPVCDAYKPVGQVVCDYCNNYQPKASVVVMPGYKNWTGALESFIVAANIPF